VWWGWIENECGRKECGGKDDVIQSVVGLDGMMVVCSG